MQCPCSVAQRFGWAGTPTVVPAQLIEKCVQNDTIIINENNDIIKLLYMKGKVCYTFNEGLFKELLFQIKYKQFCDAIFGVFSNIKMCTMLSNKKDLELNVHLHEITTTVQLKTANL